MKTQARMDSNHRHIAEATALPTELRHLGFHIRVREFQKTNEKNKKSSC